MVWEQVESIKKISIYLKVSTKIGHSVVQIFTKLGDVYGSDKISYERVKKEISEWHRFRQRCSKI